MWNPFVSDYQSVDSIEDALRRVGELAELICGMWLQRHPKQDALADVPDAVAPIPHRPQFQPRDKSGNPIPRWRWQDMTMAQRRATYGDPDDVELQAIALAEEAAMFEAEQRAAAQQDDSAPAQLSSSLSQ